MRRRRKSAHRNSKNGWLLLAQPPARISSPTRLRNGSSTSAPNSGKSNSQKSRAEVPGFCDMFRTIRVFNPVTGSIALHLIEIANRFSYDSTPHDSAARSVKVEYGLIDCRDSRTARQAKRGHIRRGGIPTGKNAAAAISSGRAPLTTQNEIEVSQAGDAIQQIAARWLPKSAVLRMLSHLPVPS